MKLVLILLIALVCFNFVQVPNTYGQAKSSKHFAAIDREIAKKGYLDSHEPFPTLFDKERRKLGKTFQKELLKYLKNDVEKHYWISIFLEAPSLQKQSKPLPLLSLLIKQQALALCAGKSDPDSLSNTVSLAVTAAVLCKKLNLDHLAIFYKNQAEELIKENQDLRYSFPAMEEFEHKLYESIK
ncbi:MAG: hypothetical protein WAQ98_01380 [Blastocatellia bacterium]